MPHILSSEQCVRACCTLIKCTTVRLCTLSHLTGMSCAVLLSGECGPRIHSLPALHLLRNFKTRVSQKLVFVSFLVLMLFSLTLLNAFKPADAGVCTTARTIDACPSLTALSSACCNSLTTFTPCCELGSFEPADTSASGRRSEATPSPGKKGVARSWSRQFSCLSLTSGSPGPGGNSCCMQGLLCTQL